ncbi:hypothetical protein D9M69_435340 [compost metagenome]
MQGRCRDRPGQGVEQVHETSHGQRAVIAVREGEGQAADEHQNRTDHRAAYRRVFVAEAGQPALKPWAAVNANSADDQYLCAITQADGGRVDLEMAHQIGRHPGRKAVDHDGQQRHADEVAHVECAVQPEKPQHITQAVMLYRGRGCSFQRAPCGFADSQEQGCQNQAWGTDHDKGQLPGAEARQEREFFRQCGGGANYNAARDQRQPCTQRRPEHENAHCPGQSLAAEVIGYQRETCWRQAGFSRPHACAGDKQLPVFLAQAAQNGEGAPQRHAENQHVAAVAVVDPAPEDRPECDVRHHE